MDYEQMSVSELREACQARGLGTARSKAELIQRLTDHDSEDAGGQDDVVEVVVPVTPDTVPALFFGADERGAVPGVFRMEFPADPDGPDEETHLAYRQATIQAAVEAGHAPRGDARLAETSDGMWVYEVLVRQADLS